MGSATCESSSHGGGDGMVCLLPRPNSSIHGAYPAHLNEMSPGCDSPFLCRSYTHAVSALASLLLGDAAFIRSRKAFSDQHSESGIYGA